LRGTYDFTVEVRPQNRRAGEWVKGKADAFLQSRGIVLNDETVARLELLVFEKEQELYNALIARIDEQDDNDKGLPEVSKGWASVFDAWASRDPAPRTVGGGAGTNSKLTQGGTDPSKVTKVEVIAWKDSMVAMGHSAKTINNDSLAAVKTVFKRAVQKQHLGSRRGLLTKPLKPTLKALTTR
jgi:hypothetical protein